MSQGAWRLASRPGGGGGSIVIEPAPDPVAVDEGVARLYSDLAATLGAVDPGTQLPIGINRNAGEPPRIVEARDVGFTLAGASPEDMVSGFVADYAGALGIDPGELTFLGLRDLGDGAQFATFDQVIAGFPLLLGYPALEIKFGTDGNFDYLINRTVPGYATVPAASPTFTGADAEAIVLSESLWPAAAAGGGVYTDATGWVPESLIIKGSSRYRLVHVVRAAEPDVDGNRLFLVDAGTGEVLVSDSAAEAAPMKMWKHGGRCYVDTEPPDVYDRCYLLSGIERDACDTLKVWMADYSAWSVTRFEWDGWDGEGSTYEMHFVDPEGDQWLGDPYDRAEFCLGYVDEEGNPCVTALDDFGHEWGHGIATAMGTLQCGLWGKCRIQEAMVQLRGVLWEIYENGTEPVDDDDEYEMVYRDIWHDEPVCCCDSANVECRNWPTTANMITDVVFELWDYHYEAELTRRVLVAAKNDMTVYGTPLPGIYPDSHLRNIAHKVLSTPSVTEGKDFETWMMQVLSVVWYYNIYECPPPDNSGCYDSVYKSFAALGFLNTSWQPVPPAVLPDKILSKPVGVSYTIGGTEYLYLFFRCDEGAANDDGICYVRRHISTWEGPYLLGHGLINGTDKAPAVAVNPTNNRLYVVWKAPGAPKNILYRYYNPSTQLWSNAVYLPAGVLTNNAPTAAYFDGYVVVGWKDYVEQSGLGANKWIRVGETTIRDVGGTTYDPPTMVAFEHPDADQKALVYFYTKATGEVWFRANSAGSTSFHKIRYPYYMRWVERAAIINQNDPRYAKTEFDVSAAFHFIDSDLASGGCYTSASDPCGNCPYIDEDVVGCDHDDGESPPKLDYAQKGHASVRMYIAYMDDDDNDKGKLAYTEFLSSPSNGFVMDENPTNVPDDDDAGYNKNWSRLATLSSSDSAYPPGLVRWGGKLYVFVRESATSLKWRVHEGR